MHLVNGMIRVCASRAIQQSVCNRLLVYGAAVLGSGEPEGAHELAPEIPRILPHLPRPSMRPAPASVS